MLCLPSVSHEGGLSVSPAVGPWVCPFICQQPVSQLLFDYLYICITVNVVYVIRPWNIFSNSLYNQESCMKGRNGDRLSF